MFTLKIFWRAFGTYKTRIIVLIIVSFLGGLFEGIGINSIIPLFSFVVKDQNQTTDSISKFTENIFNYIGLPYELKYLLIIIALLFIGKSLMVFLTNYITDRIKNDYIKKTRSKLFKLTLNSNWTYLSKQKIGYLEKVLMTDINTYSALLSYTSSTVILMINTIIYVVIAFNISPIVIGITISMGGIFFLAFKPLVYRVRIVSHQSADILKKVANHINESMIGMKTIKAMHLESEVYKHGTSFFEDLKNIEIKTSVLTSLTYVVTQPLSVLLIIGLFIFSYKLTDFNFASFAVIVYAINKIFTYIQDGQARIQNINSLYPFLKTAFDYEAKAIQNQENDGNISDIDFKADIIIKDLYFKYDGKDNTLNNINMRIDHGKITGIIGPSGSGKTTIVDLILKLIEPESGSISIGEINISDIRKDVWRNNIGYVSQDVFLINDTIENNIKLHNTNISEEDMINATKIANIYDFINSLPNKFKSHVGERGMEISGGQRQRIALARVLARKPKIIILDEATSSLDNESETMVQQAIDRLRGDVTVIIIAHRPTTVEGADKLIVLRNGNIVESGTPSELRASENSYFHKIISSK